jgi:hypothetical protein
MFALKLPSQIKEGSSQTAYVAAQQRKAEMLAKQQAEAKAAIAPSPDEKIDSSIAQAAIAAAAAQRLQVKSSADEWSSVREAVRVHQRVDDAASLASTPTTFSRVSFLPSDHSQQRVVERGISEHQIKQAKVSGRMSLAVSFDDDYLEQQAITKAREWGEQLKAALGLSLGDAKPKGPPGDRRIEVELVRSEGRARDVKRWLVDNGYFSNRNRVMYILKPSAREEIVVVEGLIDYQIDDVGLITVIRRVDNELEFEAGRPSNYKTRMCLKWQQHGECSFGNRCNFAHGSEELRPSAAAPAGELRPSRALSFAPPSGAAPAAPAANQNSCWCSRTLVPWNPKSLASCSVNVTTVFVDANGAPTSKNHLYRP